MSTVIMIAALLVFFGLSLMDDRPWTPYLLGFCAAALVVYAFTDPADRYLHLSWALFGAYLAQESWKEQRDAPAPSD